MTNQAPSPSEIYLQIAERAQDPDNYPFVQQQNDLNVLLTATAALIRENSALQAKETSASAYIGDLEAQLFRKDIELFAAIQQLNNPEGGLTTV